MGRGFNVVCRELNGLGVVTREVVEAAREVLVIGTA